MVLVDARNGLVTQSKRHAFISTLLNIPHIVVAINKMDLVDYSEEVYQQICDDFRTFASRLEVKGLTFIPISALLGDNVVDKSANMPWYQGSTFLHFLETVNTGASLNLIDFRYPVQYVLRPHQDFRGFAGRIASGRVGVGDDVVSLPSGAKSKVASIQMGEKPMEEAFVGDSVVLCLEDEIDVSRGDLLVRSNNLPRKSQNIDATICWLSEVPFNPRQDYFFKLTTREVKCSVNHIDYLINVDTMHREEVRPFQLNDIGRLQLRLAEPIYFDTYRRNRELGSFVLIDPVTHNTVAGGMIRGISPDLNRLVKKEVAEKRNLKETARLVSQEERHQKQGHKGAVVWLTGLSGAGKSTIAVNLEKQRFDADFNVMLLDGDSVRQGLCWLRWTGLKAVRASSSLPLSSAPSEPNANWLAIWQAICRLWKSWWTALSRDVKRETLKGSTPRPRLGRSRSLRGSTRLMSGRSSRSCCWIPRRCRWKNAWRRFLEK